MASVELVAPVDGEQHDPAPREPPRRVVEQLTRRAVGPVNVVENEEQATGTGPGLEERDDRLEEAQLRLGGIAPGRGWRTVGEPGKQLRQLCGQRA
jgi:hypothetical protein